MSQIHEISPKHCAKKQSPKLPKLNKKLYLYLSTLLLSILSLIFLVWLILHPTKPKFSLDHALVNQLTLSGPTSSLLNSSIQLTLQTHNPNKKVGIFYDQLSLYAFYEGEKITQDSFVPPFYQEHEEKNMISVSLESIQQPVSPSFAYKIRRDMGFGRLVFDFRVMGRLRWKVGTWVSGRYRFVVSCVSVLPFGSLPSPPLSSAQGSRCSITF